MLSSFTHFKQRDAMDCGPTCLMMIAKYFGKTFPLPYLREHCHISREGVSALGICTGAEKIGFRAMAVKVPFDAPDDAASLLQAPLPCVAHWNQNHFVVIYKANKNFVWIADPAAEKIKLKRKDFETSWCSDNHEGVLVLLDVTPEFYKEHDDIGNSLTNFAYLFQYLRPYKRLLMQVALGLGLASIFQLIFPFLTQSLVDVGINNKNIGFIYIVLFAQLMLFVSQMSVNFIQSRITLFIGTRINVSLVSDFLAKLMRLPIGFFDTKMVGDLMQRIGDQARIESFLTSSTLSVLFSVVNFLIFSIVLLTYNVTIFGVFAIAASLYILWITLFFKKRKEIDYVRFQQMSDNSNTLVELVQGMQEIKLQGSERKRRWIWAGIQAKLFRTSQKSLNLGQWQDAGAGFINQSKDIFISFFAAKAVIDGQLTLGQMLATQYIVGQLNAPLQQFIAFMRSAQDAKISLERLSEIQHQPDEDTYYQGLTIPNSYDIATANFQITPTSGADLYLENVSYRYNLLADEVLRNINLTIPKGKVTAIVGTSGSGKTTLIKLLLGFYAPTKGNIRVGKLSLQQITPSLWRKSCGVVMQEGYIFSDTIANNIAECDEKIDRERLLNATQIANIQPFIEALPLSYNYHDWRKRKWN